MIVIVIVIVIVLSRGYDRGTDIRVSYARTGCLVDMVTGEFPYAWPWDDPLDSMLLLLCLMDVYDLMYIYMLSDVDMLI